MIEAEVFANEPEMDFEGEDAGEDDDPADDAPSNVEPVNFSGDAEVAAE
ncbi:hypothetical protein P7F88_25350 [Vibrio hannami]|nr:hypothetical protein [Vibrio hannami]MDG3089192.1 hypothetical protein [Vibrio hannami]